MAMYAYPDGTTSTNRPVDGQVFYIFNPFGTPVGIYQWDGLKDQWYDVVTMRTNYLEITANGDTTASENKNIIKKCECGSEKAGSNIHSKWCAKYSD